MTKSFDLRAALKKVCSNCKESTLKTYERNFRRLARVAGFDAVPETKGWLVGEPGKKLIRKLEKMPLNVHRHLLVSGATGVRLYTDDKERSSMWVMAMNKASNAYDVNRDRQQKTAKETEDWPAGGYKSLSAAASTIKRKILGLLKKKEYTHEEQYLVQKYIILQLFSKTTFRLSPASFLLKPSTTENTLLRPRGQRKFVATLRHHKTDHSMGVLTVPLPLSTSKILSTYLPKIRKNKKHDYFLSLRDGKKMSRSALSKLMLRLTKSILGSKVGVRLARVLKVTANRAKIEEVSALQRELGHSSRTQRRYIRKDQPKGK